MRFKRTFGVICVLLIIISVSIILYLKKNADNYGAPPYAEDDTIDNKSIDPNDFSNWKRPEGPLRVGLQAGHWKTSEMPDEQTRIRETGQGTSSQGVAEWEVNLAIAEEAAKVLEAEGIVVDILPATVPVDYWADVFVSIHADGNLDWRINGYKVAAYRRDLTGKGKEVVRILEEVYGNHTGLTKDPNISRNMTGYYAFNWRRYDHAIHPMTPGIILETGFLTNPSDARMLINNPQLPAKALTEALIQYLKTLE